MVDTIRKEISKVDGVRALHMLRSRRSGGDALVDLHVQVDPCISVSEGHQIGDTVRRRLMDRVDEVTDVTVHIDPEDDEQESLSDKLPLRRDLIGALQRQWADIEDVDAENITLHYLRGKLSIDLELPLSVLETVPDTRELIDKIEQAAKELPEVDSVQVSFRA